MAKVETTLARECEKKWNEYLWLQAETTFCAGLSNPFELYSESDSKFYRAQIYEQLDHPFSYIKRINNPI